MTVDAFRKLALALPETIESLHMNHPDFRVGKRVFATLGYPDSTWGMINLTPLQQAQVVASYPRIFSPVKGRWGEKGATNVRLRTATRQAIWPALVQAWKNRAAATLSARYPDLD